MWNHSDSPDMKWRPKLGIWTGGKNNKFDPETFKATSYNWWTYVVKIKGKVVFNNYPYSTTTQSHQSKMRDLLKYLGIKIDVEVSMRESLSNFENEALPPKYEALYEAEISLKRANKNHVGSYKDTIQKLKVEIKTCRAIGAKMTSKQMQDCKKQVLASDAARLERARKERAEAKAIKAKLKPELTDLGPISLEVFKQNNNLDEIDLNQNTNKGVDDAA